MSQVPGKVRREVAPWVALKVIIEALYRIIWVGLSRFVNAEVEERIYT